MVEILVSASRRACSWTVRPRVHIAKGRQIQVASEVKRNDINLSELFDTLYGHCAAWRWQNAQLTLVLSPQSTKI